MNPKISRRMSIETNKNLGTHIIDDVSVSTIQTGDDPITWNIEIEGPKDTPYINGLFHLVCKIPYDYPNNGPDIYFTTPIYHPLVCDKGTTFCECFYKGRWSPANQIFEVIEKIVKMIKDPNFLILI